LKSINIIYSNRDELIKFISEQNLNNANNILVQIFSGILDKNLIQSIVNILKENIKNVKIIGSSTDGEIIDGEVTNNQIILNFNIFENTQIETILLKKSTNSYKLGQELATKLITSNTKLIITFADALNVNGEEYIKGIQSISNVFIAGGLAGDNGLFKETFVFNEKEIITNGCVGVSLNSDTLKVSNEFGFNWEGIGKIMHITKSKGNIVYEIDGKTPVEIYRHYFGEDVAKDVVKIGVEFPLIIKKDNISIARAVVGQNDDGSLIFAGNINTGEKVQFGYGNIESILQKDEILFQNLKNFDIESIFIYSCMARRRFLGKMIESEVKPFSKIATVSGFFTYGEFFTFNNKNQFFNQTMTVLLLSESENKHIIPKENIEIEKSELLTLKALTNLIQATSHELMELNNSLEEKVNQKTEQIKAKNIELEYLYYHDSLTDLPNKFLLEKDLKENEFFGSLLIDIKNFSSINDMYGELIGDEVLKAFSKQLQLIASKYNCSLYRVGNDQFITINYNNQVVCRNVKNSIFEMLHSEPIIITADNNLISIHLSARISLVKKFYHDIKLKADLALNYAKEKNLDFVEYSEELELEAKLEKEIKTIAMVKKAIKEDRVLPVFQRIKKEDGDTYECLVRIKEDDKLLSPYFFLDTIMHTNYYYDITKIMIKKSFEAFKDRKETISINFSFKDIENEEIIEYLISNIKQYDMYSRVIIELLESENINNFENVQKFIDKIKEYGVKIAIDDFGTGYSNFIYLAKMKPDFIKIDGSLIKHIDKDHQSFIITKHINNFAKELGCKTIAEFVHNKNVCNKVTELNVDGFQGYFVEEPHTL